MTVVFSSLLFLYVFLPIILLLYFSFKNTMYRNWILIVGSFLFYAWGEPVWVSLLALSAVIAYISGLLLQRSYQHTYNRKIILVLSISFNLLILVSFKYVGFLVDSINSILPFNIQNNDPGLPIGISFYTFQAISYLVDVYRGHIKAQRSPVKMLMYLSLFPQLVAGPIVRYSDIEEQMNRRTVSLQSFNEGIFRFVVGLGKKVIFANMAAEGVHLFLDGNVESVSIIGAWLGITLFAIQIYFDFSGYSDMAIGLGKMFGFTYPENFNYPYISRSASEFWRRWNMTLGRFFRDYVYIPLGGNRKLYVRNLFVVWFLTGLWHGASWNFIFWGLFFGLFIYIERTFLLRWLERLPALFSHTYLIYIMLIGWVFFYFTDLTSGIEFLKSLHGLNGNLLYSVEVRVFIIDNFLLIGSAILCATPIIPYIIKKTLTSRKEQLNLQHPIVSIFNLFVFGICTALLVGSTYNPFLYFRF